MLNASGKNRHRGDTWHQRRDQAHLRGISVQRPVPAQCEYDQVGTLHERRADRAHAKGEWGRDHPLVMSMKTGHCSQRAWATVLATVLICISAGVAMADPVQDRKEKIIMPLAVTSLSFQHNGTIPARHTCDGRNVSPPLSWTGVPVGAKSLVMIIDDPDAPDPDAPMMTWVHWVLYNIPPGANGLPESVAEEDLPPGTLQGMNSWQHTGYGGPCPPIGNHRYYHKLYALDTMLPDLHHPTEAALEKAMGNHIIARAELIGRYRRH